MRVLAGAMLAAGILVQPAMAQAPPETVGPPNWAATKAFSDKAFASGRAMWKPTADFFCVPGGQRANDISDPAIEPVKLFDNVWALGDQGTVVYAVITDDGIVLIDALYPAKLQSTLLPQMAKAGLDPAQVKYVLVTHGHADHYGGSSYFQSKSGARVALSAKDWDLIAGQKPNPASPAPTRDIVTEEGKAIRIGGLDFTPVDVPAHTPGSLGWIFPVKDGGKTHMAALFGSSLLRTDHQTVPVLSQEVGSWEHFRAMAAKLKVDVELQNHPLFDNMWEKVAALKARQPGQPNPFIVGADSYHRYVGVIADCMRSTIARKGGTPPKG